MANVKKIYCYTYDVLMNNTICKKEDLFKIINNIFSDKKRNVTELKNENKVLIIKDDNGNYSLELLKRVNGIKIKNDYMFFRIGRKKEIEGALKRNKKTYISEEILSKEQQEKYDIEICTYILIDKQKGIMLELFGQFAPSVRAFINIINDFLLKKITSNKVSIRYKNILTEKMIESFKEDGVRLGRIEYTYNIPSARVLNNLGLDMEQIKTLEELDVFQVEIKIKNKPRLPLTKLPEKIKYVVEAFKDCKKDIKDTIVFNGSSGKLGSKDYSFKEEEVTYPINITNSKTQDNLTIKLTLDEVAEQIYKKMKDIYEKNKNNILEYIE